MIPFCIRGGPLDVEWGGVEDLLRGKYYFCDALIVHIFFLPDHAGRYFLFATDIVVPIFFLPDHVGGKQILPKTFK